MPIPAFKVCKNLDFLDSERPIGTIETQNFRENLEKPQNWVTETLTTQEIVDAG